MSSLCQDCLRECEARPEESWDCPRCGGETCDCPSCLATLALLHSGVRDADDLGLSRPVDVWSPDGGARFLTENDRRSA